MQALRAVRGGGFRGPMGILAVAASLTLGWTAPAVLADGTSPATHPSSLATPPSFDRAAIIPIRDEITDVTRDSIRRRIKTAREQGDKLIVFELDTPGGMVTSTLDICDDIKRLRDDGFTTYAWVNPRAYSGGTIIALATDGIVMAHNATMGDCQPIIMTSTGVGAVPEEVEAKMKSPLVAELRDSARRNGYDMDMVMSLIDPEIEIFWVENTRTGERRFVTPRQRDELFGLATDTRPVAPEANSSDKKDRRTQDSPPVSDTLSKTDWKYVTSAPRLGRVDQPIDGARTLLTMKTVEAEAYGFAKTTVDDPSDLARYFNVRGPVQRLDSNWFETVVEWLASPMVRGVLFLLMLLGAYAEFHTPGFGVAGSVALVALVLFLAAPYLAGFTVTWEIVVILLGLVLLAVEVFVAPGTAVPGIAGVLLLGVGLIASFVPRELPMPGSGGSAWWPTLPLTMDYLKRGLWALAGGTGGALLGAFVLARYLPKVALAGGLVSPNPTRAQVQPDDPYPGIAQLGHIGKTEGTLRPAGKARFGAVLVDVVSDGEFIPPGTRVEVIERSGARVVVRRVD